MSLRRSNLPWRRHRRWHIMREEVTSLAVASLYVLSGVSQPLLMTILRESGLTDPSCQIYMFFYYLGPTMVVFSLRPKDLPSSKALRKAVCIAFLDLSSQTLNYTGSSMAGPTLFAIIYSSVAVWAAIFSRVLLKRALTTHQWLGVGIVFFGLAITGLDSVSVGHQIWSGSCLVIVGSMMNALTYVLSESIMTTTGSEASEALPVSVNCAIQGSVGCIIMFLWQVIYTRPWFNALVRHPMDEVHTSNLAAMFLLILFALLNFVHYISFFHALKHSWGGSTSAGVMKALQAVLVFVVTSVAYCGQVGGHEMCFSRVKLVSLVIVVGGVLLFGRATTQADIEKVTRRDYKKLESKDDEF